MAARELALAFFAVSGAIFWLFLLALVVFPAALQAIVDRSANPPSGSGT